MTGEPILFVHSPLVGPSTWQRLISLATAEGHEAIGPDLTGFANSPRPRWETFVNSAVSAAARLREPIVVGHSGAGALLPSIAERLVNPSTAIVFVDAIVPAASGQHRATTRQVELLDAQTIEGKLAGWLDWWPADVIDELLPLTEDREAIAADMPTLWRDTYDDPLPVPNKWTDWPCGYLQLSDAYSDDLNRAAQFGWPTAHLDSSHLGIITDVERTMHAIQDLVGQLKN